MARHRRARDRSLRGFSEVSLNDEHFELTQQPRPRLAIPVVRFLKHQYDRRKKTVKRK